MLQDQNKTSSAKTKTKTAEFRSQEEDRSLEDYKTVNRKQSASLVSSFSQLFSGR